MNKSDRRQSAYEMFFNEHLKINEIAEALNLTRQTVSSYLKTFENYESELNHRKSENKKRRKAYKKHYIKAHREKDKRKSIEAYVKGLWGNVYIPPQNEHHEAVKVLSHEKF